MNECGINFQMLCGSSVLKDGRSVLDVYGLNLSNIVEGDVIGVMKNDQVPFHSATFIFAI